MSCELHAAIGMMNEARHRTLTGDGHLERSQRQFVAEVLRPSVSEKLPSG